MNSCGERVLYLGQIRWAIGSPTAGGFNLFRASNGDPQASTESAPPPIRIGSPKPHINGGETDPNPPPSGLETMGP